MATPGQPQQSARLVAPLEMIDDRAALPELAPPTIGDDQRPHPAALALATRFALGATDSACIAWLRCALLAWARGDGSQSLSNVLHLGDSPRRFRLTLRDLWLRDAADCVSGTPWERARELAGEVDRFIGRKWAAWQHSDAPPEHATPLEVCLFAAVRAAGDLPRSPVALYRILTSQTGGTAK